MATLSEALLTLETEFKLTITEVTFIFVNGSMVNQDGKALYPPALTKLDINLKAETVLSFNETLVIPPEIESIGSEDLHLEIESPSGTEPDKLLFTWNVTSFEGSNVNLKLTF